MKLRILSYNIQSCLGIDNRWNWRRSVADIAALNPDVAAVQEVAINRPNSTDPVDYPAEAAAALGMNVIFGKALDFANGGEYGVAVFSRFPLEKIAQLPLPVPPEAEPRTVLIVKVLADEPFYVACTHFPFQGEYENDNAGRRQIAQFIHDFIVEKKLFPCLLAGDLNSAPDSEAIQFLRKNWLVLNDRGSKRPTAETSKYGWLEIDFICTYPPEAAGNVNFVTASEMEASDHYLIYADMELKKII